MIKNSIFNEVLNVSFIINFKNREIMAYNPYLLRDNKFRGQSIETYVQGGER